MRFTFRPRAAETVLNALRKKSERGTASITGQLRPEEASL